MRSRTATTVATTRGGKPSEPLFGVDKKGQPRAGFFYDGSCGVCKFSVRFVAARDATDHMRFCPLQSRLGQKLCKEHGMPTDVSSAVLIDRDGRGFTESDAILRMFPFMGFPYVLLGFLALLIPRIIRDGAYRCFAANRGRIWRGVRRVTGWGPTRLEDFRDRIVGLEGEEPLPPGWGFGDPPPDAAVSSRPA